MRSISSKMVHISISLCDIICISTTRAISTISISNRIDNAQQHPTHTDRRNELNCDFYFSFHHTTGSKASLGTCCLYPSTQKQRKNNGFLQFPSNPIPGTRGRNQKECKFCCFRKYETVQLSASRLKLLVLRAYPLE